MSMKLKAVLLIALLAGDEAARVYNKVSTANRISHATGSSQESQQEDATGTEVISSFPSWSTRCDTDVIVQAVMRGKNKAAALVKVDMIVPASDLASGKIVEVGSQPKGGCDIVYKLLCVDDYTTVQQEGCDGGKPVDGHFSWMKIWRSTSRTDATGLSAFTFSDQFQEDYISKLEDEDIKWGLAYKVVDVVHFTPTSYTCESARTKLEQSHSGLKMAVDILGKFQDGLEERVDSFVTKSKGEFKKHTDMLKPFQNAKMAYDKMGCDGTVMDSFSKGSENILSGVVIKLRETFVKGLVNLCKGVSGKKGKGLQDECEGFVEENAKKRFDDMLKYVKDHSSPTLQEGIHAAEMALNTKGNAKGGEDKEDGSEDEDIEEELQAELEDEDLEEVLVEYNGEDLEKADIAELPPVLQTAVANPPDEVALEDENLSLGEIYARQAAAAEAKAAKGNATALLQLQEGQVGSGELPPGFQKADRRWNYYDAIFGTLMSLGLFAIVAVVLTLFVTFWPVTFWFLIAAVTIAAGLTTWTVVQKKVSQKRSKRQTYSPSVDTPVIDKHADWVLPE